jgi:P-type Ca2+ transporter type 2C
MRRPPRDPSEPLFSQPMVGVSLLLGVSVLATIGVAYWWAIGTGITAQQAGSFGFAAIVFGNLAMIYSTRSRERIALQALGHRNPALWSITGGTLAAPGAAIYLPPVADIFRFAPLPAGYLAGVPRAQIADAATVSGPRAERFGAERATSARDPAPPASPPDRRCARSAGAPG